MRLRPFLNRAALLLATTILLGACTSTGTREEQPPATVVKPDSSATPDAASTGELPRSKYGNPPFYEVYGVRYTILPGSAGYRQQGIASWYGKRFNGRRTLSVEP